MANPSNVMEEITIKELVAKVGKSLDLTLVEGGEGLENIISTSELHRPGLVLAGYFETFSATHTRIQILGITEISYLNDIPEDVSGKCLEKFFSYDLPCIIVTTGLKIPEPIIEWCREKNVPLFSTPLYTSALQGRLVYFLEGYFAPRVTIHGVLLDVYGMGVLITGDSGVGKSECALELVERGHRLVADDTVIVRRLSKDLVVGKSPEATKYHMEIRGVGIVDILSLFGISGVRDEKKISLIIELERWKEEKEYERLGIDGSFREIFDVEVPEYVIPVEPGRNISIIVETATLTQKLKVSGTNVAERFNENLIKRFTVNKKRT